jgi:hypothetical protein
VSRSDADLLMPPEGEKLTAEEINLLGEWIDQGSSIPAEVENSSPAELEHWSFQPVVRRPAPDTLDPSSSESFIDRWLQASLDREQLSFRPMAEPRSLARRLWLDLVGLPPDLADIERMERSNQPDQYEREVDRLLASPRLGERWARHWLDVVRFAETNGFEMNQPREKAWPYRDYVIESINTDRPYDEFVRQQIAGDSLEADEATGFLVGGPWDQVKSPDPALTAQQRADELHDMVSTTGSAFLGLTVGCARCHRHKFDPISQSDYYRLKATLEGVRHGEREIASAKPDERSSLLAKIQKDLPALESQRRRAAAMASLRTIAWLDGTLPGNDSSPWVLLVPPVGDIPLQPGPDRGRQADPGGPGRLPTLVGKFPYWNPAPHENLVSWKPPFAGRFRVWVSWGMGRSTHSPDTEYWMDQDGDLSTSGDQSLLAVIDQRAFADGSPARGEAPLWSGLRWIGDETFGTGSRLVLRSGRSESVVTASAVCFEEVSPNLPASTMPSLRSAVQTGENVERFEPQPARMVRMTIEATNSAEPCIDEMQIFSAEAEPRNVALADAGAKVSASSTFPGNPIHQLAHLNDGVLGNEKSWISAEPGRGQITVTLPTETLIDTVVWGRDQTEPPRYTDRVATRYGIEVSLDGQTWKQVAGSIDRLPMSVSVSPVAIDTARNASPDAARTAKLLARRQELLAQLRRTIRPPMVYGGVFETPGPTMRLHRGDPLSPREPVEPGTLSAIGPPAPQREVSAERDRRRMLADWLTEDAHPLPWRVMANRLWQQHFGEGIVATPSDFGRNGALPSHPELLDQLAAELVEHDFSLKHLHRLIVTSRAYRQASTATPEGLARDGQSRLLWRYPPRRVDAEPLRDMMLAVSGNLDLSMGGPGFSLFEPNENYVRVYKSKQVFGPAEWRRMIYQTKVRMQLDDTFGAFDCPDAGQIAPKRSRSTTPLQALNLLHSAFVLDQAERLAETVQREIQGEERTAIDRLYERALQRRPDPIERVAAERLVQQTSLATLARAIFNSNEFLWVD